LHSSSRVHSPGYQTPLKARYLHSRRCSLTSRRTVHGARRRGATPVTSVVLFEERVDGAASIDDVLDDQHVTAIERPLDLVRDLHPLSGVLGWMTPANRYNGKPFTDRGSPTLPTCST
jgi:hypothetical protein